MDYSKTVPFTGDIRRVLDTAASILATNGFAITGRGDRTLECAGPGLRSTRQNPLLGASRIVLDGRDHDLSLTAELGGVETMRRFLRWFPFLLGGGLALLFAAGMAVGFGPRFHLGGAVPWAAGWPGIALVSLLAFLPVTPWLVLSPLMARGIRNRTVAALDVLVANATAIATDTKRQ